MTRVSMRLARVAVLALAVATQAAAQDPGTDEGGAAAIAPGVQDVAPPERTGADGAPNADAVQSAEEASDQSARSKVKTLGEGTEQIEVVEHPSCWSMHVENVPAGKIFSLWHELGGPAVASKQVLDFPFTMSVHQVSAERLVARILETWSYTLHYEKGRLAEVRVLGAIPERQYKTPRLVESRAQWTSQEITLLTAQQKTQK